MSTKHKIFVFSIYIRLYLYKSKTCKLIYTNIHTFTRCRKRESEERIRLGEWEFDIPRLQQYVQLHKPEQRSITYLTLALTFSMRLKSILKLHQFQQESGVLYLQLLCLRIPFCPPSLRERVSPKSLIGLEFRSRWSGRWFLAGFAEFLVWLPLANVT